MNRQTLYNSLLSTLPLALLVLDKNQKIIYFNKSFYLLLDNLEKELENGAGSPITLYQELRGCIEQVQKEGGHREVELHIEHTAGEGSILRAIVSKLSFSEKHTANKRESSSERSPSDEGVHSDIRTSPQGQVLQSLRQMSPPF